MEGVLLQNAFLINYKKFVHYFSKDLPQYDYDDDDDEVVDDDDGYVGEYNEEHGSESPPLHFLVTSELLLVSPLNEIPKLLRFNDDINVISINRYLPVDHVLYNQFIKQVE